MSKTENTGAIIEGNVTVPTTELAPTDQAIATAAATREPPRGVKGAVETIRNTVDEGAHVLWTANGPRNSHIAELGAVLITVDDAAVIYLVQAFDSGAFKVFASVPGKAGADQCAHLTIPH